MKLMICILAALSLAGQARAHDAWKDGMPIPSWIKAQCCGPADAHHLRLDQIHREPGGWNVEGYPALIPDDKVLPSMDGEAWIFYRELSPGVFTNVYCFFYPASI